MTAADSDDDLSDLDPPTNPDTGAEPDSSAAGTEPGPQLAYPTVDAWVSDFLAHTYARDVTEPGATHRWCSQWWKHPEALDRLDALWRAWETLRRDPTTGPATWWIHYADPTMTALMAPDGPFARCRRTGHATNDVLIASLPTSPPPEGLFAADL